jgi:RHS repeat-associated protein
MNGTLLVQYSNSTTYFPVLDQIGSVRLLTAMDASVAECHDYLPFGELISYAACTYGSEDDQYQFAGYQQDWESGLDNAQARYYSSPMGRFMSPDLFGGQRSDPQSLNRYSYVVNNPLRFVDPTGLWHCVWSGSGGEDDTEENGGASMNQCFDQDHDAIWVSDPGDSDALGQPCAIECAMIGAPSIESSSLGNVLSAGGSPQPIGDGDDTLSPDQDIFHCAGCQAMWNSTANGMNTVTKIYGATYATALGAPYAISGAARAIGWGYATFTGTAATSAIVLGGSPGYYEDAKAIGATYLKLPDILWDIFESTGDAWTANQTFLNVALNRDYDIFMTSQPGGYYTALEMQYLLQRGIDVASLPVLNLPH